ncbi:hypothetical protein T492DRAFT_921089 [Pavlovales sp. CCMP2436]|nr:hypothetical protein T492DRAFT_921089 [Pavlovales sp. CCMP2436]
MSANLSRGRLWARRREAVREGRPGGLQWCGPGRRAPVGRCERGSDGVTSCDGVA